QNYRPFPALILVRRKDGCRDFHAPGGSLCGPCCSWRWREDWPDSPVILAAGQEAQVVRAE
ncbi:hypothetical protein XENOCAPTIV_020062, partial [Xenoophorus captivus]